jgi:DNA-directed RNA polymerase subunit RPC12/RpoP
MEFLVMEDVIICPHCFASAHFVADFGVTKLYECDLCGNKITTDESGQVIDDENEQ